MINKFKYILTVILLLNCFFGQAQSLSNKVTLELLSPRIFDNYLCLKILIENHDERGILLYKPTFDDICNEDILRIDLIEMNTNKKHKVFPCDYVSQVFEILPNITNTIYLKRGEGFLNHFKVKLDNITPYIKEGAYWVIVSYNTTDITFGGNYSNVLKIKLVSEKVKVSY